MLPTYLYGLSILNSNRKEPTMRYYDDFEPPIEFAYGELNQIMREENYYVF